MKTIKVVCFSILCVSCPLQAKWQLSPEISIQQFYSSNIELNSGLDRQSEWVTEVAPSLTVENAHSKNPLLAYYRAQALYYMNDSRSDKIYHQGLFKASKQYWGDRLTFSVTGDHAQTVLFPASELTVDNIRGSNTTNVSRVIVGPSFNHKLGSNFRTDYRYQFGQIIYHQDVPNAMTHDLDFNLGSTSTNHWTMNAYGHWDTTRQDAINIAESFDSLVSIGYFLTSRLRPFAAWGYENHQNQPNLSDLDGPRWHVGVAYQPLRRLSLSGYIGQRAFGDTFDFSATWQKKYSSLTASYHEEVTNFFRTQLSALPTITVNDLGLVSIQFQPQVRNDVFIRKVASLNWQSKTTKFASSITPYLERREVDTANSREEGAGLNVELSWLKSQKLQMALIGGYAYQQLVNQQHDKRLQVGIRVEHQLSRKTDITYGYRYFELRRTSQNTIFENNVNFAVHFKS